HPGDLRTGERGRRPLHGEVHRKSVNSRGHLGRGVRENLRCARRRFGALLAHWVQNSTLSGRGSRSALLKGERLIRWVEIYALGEEPDAPAACKERTKIRVVGPVGGIVTGEKARM